ncbi:TAP-like protein-domain-containing protein [Aspergillus cavernicola]|uniref:TAP-like protein-domain-containing protein n=1 Tax=Aspergillus cavernicola TaxID=176166 RepID=A0ABR4IEV2_9EURO
MPSSRALLQAFLLLGGASSTLAHLHSRTDGVSWGACEFEAPGIECANFTVPLDYTTSDSEATLDLQLLRVPAIQTPKKGTVLFNFGGPGLEARLTLAGSAATYLALTNGEYDLVAFDPRGTANTMTASCFNTSAERALLVSQPMTVVPNTDDELALGRLWGQTGIVADSCLNALGEQLSLIGTSFVAQDMLQIVDALEDDGLLRYWGTSYGTALGATFAAMYPDRVERMILDGNLNPHEYFNFYEIEVWADSDRVFLNLLKECMKTPDLCALAHRRDHVEDLEKDIYNLIEDLRKEPLISGTTLVDSSLVKTYLRFGLYSPIFYPVVARSLNELLDGNATQLANSYNALSSAGVILTQADDDAQLAITCSDKKLPEQSFTEMAPVFEALEDQSRLLGSHGHIAAMLCQQWGVEAKGRYEGNFEATTNHPMLIINNRFDPATPIRSAQNVSAGFENSVLLENGGFGHGLTSHASTCTINAIRQYYQDGTLPEPGTICDVDYSPFDAIANNITTVLTELGYLPGSGAQ